MMLSETEERLLASILSLRTEKETKKLKVLDVSVRAGVTRQTIYKIYRHLLPVIKDGKDTEKFQFVSKEAAIFQEQVVGAKLSAVMATKELDNLRKSIEKKQQKFREQVLSEYMQGVIQKSGSRTLSQDILSLQKQLNDRNEEINQARMDNVSLETKVFKLEGELNSYKNTGSNSVNKKIYELDLSSAFDTYKDEGDWETWLREKKTLTRYMIKQVVDNVELEIAIVLVIHQYNADLKLVSDNYYLPAGSYIFISVALPIAVERKRLVSELKRKTGLPVLCVCPFTTNANARWYRQMKDIHVPKHEIQYVDNNWQQPSINEGYKSIFTIEINYGN